jgi:uncharacterized protein (DUF849 family)
VNERALARGHGIRTGLEDTPVLPDGRPAPDNAALVRAAALMRATFGSTINDESRSSPERAANHETGS